MREGLLTVVTASLVVTLAASAAGIVGTDGADTIRGTPGADRISTRGGNDKLLGLAGADVLTGGLGRDVVNGGAGADVVLGDCETLRISPPEPQAPPPRPVVPGLYGGRTTQGQLVTLQVSSGGTLSQLVLPVIELSCSPTGGPSVSWSQDFGAATTVIQRDGRFTIEDSGTRGVEGGDATYRIVVSGLLIVGIATGSVKLDVATRPRRGRPPALQPISGGPPPPRHSPVPGTRQKASLGLTGS